MQYLLPASQMCLSAGGSIWNAKGICQEKRFIYKSFQENAQRGTAACTWYGRVIGGGTYKAFGGME